MNIEGQYMKEYKIFVVPIGNENYIRKRVSSKNANARISPQFI